MSLVLVLVCLSVDVTGALALSFSFCVEYLHVLHAPLPIYPFCHLALLWSGVCCLLLPCRCCPPRRPDGSVGMAWVLPALTDCRWWFESLLVHSGVSSATRRKATGADHKKKNVSVLSSSLLSLLFVCLCVWFPVGSAFSCFLWLRGLAPPFCSLCSSRFLCGFRCFRVACFSLVVFPVSVLLASPAPRIVSCVLWSSLHSCVLVPPSEYLVAAVTAPLPCFHAGCMVLLCFPSAIRFMATKAFCPVWGFLPSTPCYW